MTRLVGSCRLGSIPTSLQIRLWERAVALTVMGLTHHEGLE